MHYSRRTFLSTLTFTALQSISLAIHVPSRTAEHRQLYDGPTQFTLPELGDLAQFVCPKKSTNIFRRQSAGLSQVSTEQIRDILDMLYAYEESTLTLINGILVADGIDPASAAPSSFMTIAAPPLELSQPVATDLPSLSPRADSAVVPARQPLQRPKGVACIPVTTTIIERLTYTQTQTVTVSAACATVAASTTLAADLGAATTQAAATTDGAAASTSDFASQPTYPAYTFNAGSNSNVAVYFGQTPATGATSLEAQCADPNTDIVILAFVVEQLDGGAYPQLNFGAACGGQTPLMTQQAPGLLSCPELAGNISVCQSGWGKKVMLSIGGSTSNIKFGSVGAATKFAGVLWNLFGPAGNVNPELRPFGDVEVDGFDIGSCSFALSSLFHLRDRINRMCLQTMKTTSPRTGKTSRRVSEIYTQARRSNTTSLRPHSVSSHSQIRCRSSFNATLFGCNSSIAPRASSAL